MICYLPQEREFLPWHAASRALYQLDKLLDRTEDYSLFSVRVIMLKMTTNIVRMHMRSVVCILC